MRQLKFGYLIGVFWILGCTPSSEPILPPDGFPTFEINHFDPNGFDGYISLRKIEGPGAQFTIDKKGDLISLHQHDSAIIRVFKPVENRILSLPNKNRVVESNHVGDTLLDIRLKDHGIEKQLHHEIIPDGPDYFLAITHEFMPIDFSSLGGINDDTLKFDGLIKFDSKGEVVWSWKLTDVLDPFSDPQVYKYKKDWGHANSVAVDTDGNYLLSFRDFNQIWKINKIDGGVIWKYGGELIENAEDRFYGQHAIHLNQDGDYMLFDNGSARHRRSSRALAFRKTDLGFETTLKIELPDSLFSWKQGSVYQFDEDRFLFCSSMPKYLAVTSRTGDVLWMAKTDTEFYRAYYIEPNYLD